MIVVADTSPLNYLILIGQADLLYRLYGRVLIPQAVLSELKDPGAPSAIASWLKQCPRWLEICQVAIGREEISEKLDVGEAAALVLAEQYKPDVLLLMDEEMGRLEAQRRKIQTTGTLGVLGDAASRGLVDLEAALESLRKTNFRAPDSLLDWLIARHRQTRKRG